LFSLNIILNINNIRYLGYVALRGRGDMNGAFRLRKAEETRLFEEQGLQERITLQLISEE
jgi:hypothetical protein